MNGWMNGWNKKDGWIVGWMCASIEGLMNGMGERKDE
jgi:hypothetical protein